MPKKGFTIIIDEELWKRFSIKCIEKGKTKTEALSELIKKFIEGK